MKYTLKLFAIAILFSLSNSLFAYTWYFANHTDKTLVLKFKFYWDNAFYYSIVKPDKATNFSWPVPQWKAGYCMERVQWAIYDPSLPHNGGANLIQGGNVDNATFDKIGYQNRLTTAEIIYLPDFVYNETVANAERIGSAFDDVLCKIVGARAAISKMKISKVQEPILQKAAEKLQKLNLDAVRVVLADINNRKDDWIESVVGENLSDRVAKVDKIQKALQDVLASVNYKLGPSGGMPITEPEEVYARMMFVLLNSNQKLIGDKGIAALDLLLTSGTPLEYERKPEGWCRGPLSEVIAWLGGLIAKSSCRDRNFEIWELNGKISFITRAN